MRLSGIRVAVAVLCLAGGLGSEDCEVEILLPKTVVFSCLLWADLIMAEI
jgi:hypothetical protein